MHSQETAVHHAVIQMIIHVSCARITTVLLNFMQKSLNYFFHPQQYENHGQKVFPVLNEKHLLLPLGDYS